MIINNNGDTLKSKKIKDIDEIYQDCFDINHLLCEEMAYQVFIKKNSIDLIYPVKIDSFKNSFYTVLDKNDQHFYYRINTFANQILDFYVFDEEKRDLFNFRTIADDAGLERLSDRARIISSGSHPRFEQMFYYSKKHAPLLIIEDTILIFNYINDKIEFYKPNGDFISSVDIKYHKNRNWKKELYLDEATNNIYTVIKDGGISTLYKVDYHNGQTTAVLKIPKFQFVQNIKVKNNILYFLFNDVEEYNYKQLFTMNI